MYNVHVQCSMLCLLFLYRMCVIDNYCSLFILKERTARIHIYEFNNELPTFIHLCHKYTLYHLDMVQYLTSKLTTLTFSITIIYVDSKQRLRICKFMLRCKRLARYKFILFTHNNYVGMYIYTYLCKYKFSG